MNDLGYFLIALVSADWNEGEYRYGFIRHETKKLAKIWGISKNTLSDGLKRLSDKGALNKVLNTYVINNFEYFQKAHAYKSPKLSDENLREIYGNSLLENGISVSKTRISDSDLSKTTKLLNVSHKVGINRVDSVEVNTKTIADYKKIYDEGGYTSLLPEDMKWLDEHITADGRTLP